MTNKLWEYHMERGPSQERLNILGMQGWELVTVVAPVGSMDYTAFLKRPLVGEMIVPLTSDAVDSAIQ